LVGGNSSSSSGRATRPGRIKIQLETKPQSEKSIANAFLRQESPGADKRRRRADQEQDGNGNCHCRRERAREQHDQDVLRPVLHEPGRLDVARRGSVHKELRAEVHGRMERDLAGVRHAVAECQDINQVKV